MSKQKEGGGRRKERKGEHEVKMNFKSKPVNLKMDIFKGINICIW